MEIMRVFDTGAGSFGTFGDLVAAIAGLLSSSGFELVVNFVLIAVLASAGYLVGRRTAEASLAFAGTLAAVGAAMFATGAPASYFVMNAGTFFLGFLYPVWEEAYHRVSH